MNTSPTRREAVLDTPDIQNRLRTASERIVGDSSLTADLLDAEARTLLHWAQAEVERLVLKTADLDDDMAWQTLDPALRTLRRYIRRVARASAKADDPAAMLRTLLATPPVYEEA
ncbi:MAG TPA: hypothetical protein PLJ78_00630 [Anaerolineae bacterium]|nr:hypothetical protein [Anaerolineae bacterium]